MFEIRFIYQPVREALNCDILHFHKGFISINFHHISGQITNQFFNRCLRAVEDMGIFLIQCSSLSCFLFLYLQTVF